MSVQQEAVVFEQNAAHLSTELEEEGPWTIHGIAIGEGDVTRGQSGIQKKWPKEALKPAAETLEGRSLVEDHDNTSRGVVGTVLNTEYRDGVGVLYEAELHDRDLAKRVKSGLLEVSIRGYHEDVDQMSETEDGAKLVTRVRFDNLSIVPSGAAPSNTAEFGPSSELSAAECAQMMGVDVSETAIKSDDVPKVESNAPLIKEGMKFFSTVNNSELVVTDVEKQVVTVETVDGEASWDEEIENIINKLADGDWKHAGHMEEMADEPKFSQGDWVRWNTRNSTEIGKVTGSYTEGDDIPDIRGDRGLNPEEGEHLYTLRMYKERDGAFHPIEGKPIGHYEDSLRDAEKPSNVSESSVELVQSDVDVTGVERTALLASEPLVDRPTSGERRAMFHTPLVGEFGESDVNEALSIAEEELGKEVTVEMTDEGVFVQPVEDTGVGVVEFMHEHLDFIESSFDNTIDIQQKSTLFVGGDADGYSMQPCFMMDDRLSDEQLDEIARLCKFVTGVDSNPYYAENRLYLDTGQDTLAHANLDIAEILVRRMADAADIGIQSHSFKVLEETASELGRSNAEDYTDFNEDDWVQWYTEGGERHGKVTSVNSEDDEVTAQVWDQTSDGEWYETDEDVTKAFDDKIEPWGNFPREQDDFADAIDGEDPRRAVKPSEEENADPEELVSDEVEKGLKNKVEEHNEEHGDDESKRVTYRMLKNVFNRGMGAYQDSHREGMSAQQWSYARVNSFLYLVRNGNPENDAYVQDNDLLPEEHPKYDPDAPDGNEDEEENSQFVAEAQEYKEGDYVLAGLNDNLNNNKENAIHARVIEVVTDGIIKPEQISNSQPVSGTEMNPAALLEIYNYESGTWNPSQTLIAEPFSALQKWDVSQQAQYSMAPEWEEGQLVRWQAKPDFFGQIVHVDDKTHKVMVEVHEMNNGNLESTGFTVTAGYSDLMEMEADGSSKKSMEEMSAEELQDELDEVYSDWRDSVNMTASELRNWSAHPCSREASLKPVNVIKRNLRLIERNKDEWTEKDVEDAKRTISFISRMRGTDTADKDGGVHGCPSKRDISLMNWAYNPFDSMPDVPDDMQKVQEVELNSYDVPEGAEFDGNPSKYDEEHERYPEEGDTPRETREGMHEYEEERASEKRMIPVSSRIAELADYEMHQPNWDEKEPEADWNTPDLEDFESEYKFLEGSFSDLSDSEKEKIANHFLIAEGGFPGETYGDLKLPVVEPDGRLSLSALSAVKGGRGVTAVDGLSNDMENKIIGWVNETAREVFDEDWGDSESMKEITKDHEDVYMNSGAAMGRADEIGCDTVHEHEMDGDTVYMPCETHSEYRDMVSSNSYHGDKEDEDEMSNCVKCGSASDAGLSADANGEAGEDTVEVLSADRSISVVSANGTGNEPSGYVTTEKSDSIMTDKITEQELSELRQKANAYDELEGSSSTESAVEELRQEFQSDLEELKERTALLDEVNRSDVEALQEIDEPHIMSQGDFEELEEEVETVRSVYAEQLSAHTGVPQERIENKWTLEEMRDDLEDELGEDSELEGRITPDPQGADLDEKTAEENAEGSFGGSSEELSDEAQEKQDEIRSRIMG